MNNPKTLFEKVWNRHIVLQEPDFPAILYIDLHLIHEVTSPQAFQGLRAKGLSVRCPERTYATMDHSTPTTDLMFNLTDEMAVRQLRQLQINTKEFGISLLDMQDPRRGIVHIIGPELGLTHPGMTIVCGDSHTSTHGAFGTLAFGIGTTEVEHVLATQCLLQNRPKTLQVKFTGHLKRGVSAKDMILALIASIGVDGGRGYVIEYCGEAIQALDMEERMTICNMSIEAGARAGMIAPDDTTYQYLVGRPFVPKEYAWDNALNNWRELISDPGAYFDQTVVFDVTKLEPMVTYGTNPGMGISITQTIPDPQNEPDISRRAAQVRALEYMGLRPGQSLLGSKVDVVFIGSCTNSRISDLRLAASILRGRKIAANLRMLVVPGSEDVRRQAESEGLDSAFRDAGAEWRYSGCSMCIAMNGDLVQPGQYVVSTSNRNFEGRQGPGSRTFLASPLTAAASALAGYIADPRELIDSTN